MAAGSASAETPAPGVPPTSSWPPAGPAPGSAAGSGPSSRSRPRAGRSRWALGAGVVVLVVVLTLAALYAVGVGPFARPGSASGGEATGPTFLQAASLANRSGDAYGNGPWKVILAGGADLVTPFLESTAVPLELGGSEEGAPCDGVSETGNSSVVAFPAFTGSLSSGEAPVWLLLTINATGTVLVVVVLDGQASVWAKYAGPGCAPFASIGTVPGSAVDSSQAAGAFLAAGGAAFVRAHPGGFLSLSVADLEGNGGWALSYSTCPAVGSPSTSTTYYTYNATVGLTSGTVTGTPAGGTPRCAPLALFGGLEAAL